MSKEDFGDGLSPLETLSKTICSVFKLHQENSSVSPTKQSSLYFNFLNDMPSPSNSNTTPKEGNEPVMIKREKEEILESTTCGHVGSGSRDDDEEEK
ncbi:hypothetical protein Pyn_28678 [Prunus yedoensis var. nudiflora]|uniref:Uncharacterized protein n=1 Tax=Prunus yedoensis var. nudiflora TaxID=2094558 RepID=A0A314U6V3_PRUYE|nr:hypothetical protein Pyn_28678 [Prunus yedoensis var. nudiflora]